jgi:hypothetical protein
MLIEQVFGALGTLFVQNAFGFGAAKTRPVGVGLFRRLFSLGAFLKSLQVDNIPHALPHYSTNKGRAAFSWRREAGSVVIEKIPRERTLILNGL